MNNFQCTNKECIAQKQNYKFIELERCPYCKSNTKLILSNDDFILQEYIHKLPVQISRPIYDLAITSNYFKKINLVSDIIIGILRICGSLTIELARKNSLLNEELEERVNIILNKESHGLWSSYIEELLIQLDHEKAIEIITPLMQAFGVKSKSGRKIKIKQFKVENNYVDSFGKKQKVVIQNTALGLLINFRNKYLGHGTAYSEQESRKIYDIYQPILIAFLNQIRFLHDLEWSSNNVSISGYDKASKDIVEIRINHEILSTQIGNKLSFILPKVISNGKFKCEKTGCETAQKKLSFPTSQNCPECHSALIKDEHNLFDTNDETIINSYPYFIAHTYYRAISETEVYKKLHLLKECFLNYLKYLGLLTASEYFNSELRIKSINRNFKNLIYRPQFGYWNKFIRETINTLKENNHDWFIPELPDYYTRIELNMKGDTGIGTLINFRNKQLGHGKVPSIDECTLLWQANFPVLKDLLCQMDFAKDYTIVSPGQIKGSSQVWRLMGNEITTVNLREKPKSNVVLFNTKADQISLAPFFILPGKYFPSEVADHAKLMVYEQNTGKRIVFFSPESITGETSGKILQALNLIVADKEKEKPISTSKLSRKKLRERLKENNHDFYQELVGERKVVPGVYQERLDAEISLRSWIGALASLYFLTAEAGSGKTNLLLEMSKQYNDRGIDTLFLRGNRFESSDFWQELCYRLNITHKFDLNKSKAFAYTQDNPLIILIDGCNEHPEQEKVFKSILTFLNQHKGGHIKVVLSWRVNTKSELPAVDKKFEHLIYSDNIEQRVDEDDYLKGACYWLKPLNKKEVEGAWDKYTQDKKSTIKRKPNFSYEELTYHDRSLSDQLDNPLLLRLFLEMYNAKGLPKSKGGFINIWSLYHNKIIKQ